MAVFLCFSDFAFSSVSQIFHLKKDSSCRPLLYRG